jgi:hypothetical protein
VPFPEDAFVCSDELTRSYRARIDLGRRRMAQSRVVIAGLARGLGDRLTAATIVRIDRLGTLFADHRVVLFENDSNDGTLPALRQWAGRDRRVTVLSEVLGSTRYPQTRSLERAEKMAEYRNRYLARISDSYRDFEHTIVVDTDLERGWSLDGIANTFGHDDWDAVGSNGIIFKRRDAASPIRRIHFDAWAFRSLGHPQPHEGREINVLRFERGEPLLPVVSCFGGAAVYRTQALSAATYGGGDCEHVTLHLKMAGQGFSRIFLNPSQICLYSELPPS